MNGPAARRVTLIFPMAGQGARFGYTFKPFLEIDGRTFIETAVAPFRAHMEAIEQIVFVFLDAQETAHDVTVRLAAMFGDLPHKAVRLPQPTPGPAETLAQALDRVAVSGPIIVCDCDHALDVAPIFAAAADPAVRCALPTWSIEGEPLESWGVAGVEPDGRIVAIAEKALPPCGTAMRGVIGCYYFADADQARARLASPATIFMSDLVSAAIAAGEHVVSVSPGYARFFGDPARLKAAERQGG